MGLPGDQTLVVTHPRGVAGVQVLPLANLPPQPNLPAQLQRYCVTAEGRPKFPSDQCRC